MKKIRVGIIISIVATICFAIGYLFYCLRKISDLLDTIEVSINYISSRQEMIEECFQNGTTMTTIEDILNKNDDNKK